MAQTLLITLPDDLSNVNIGKYIVSHIKETLTKQGVVLDKTPEYAQENIVDVALRQAYKSLRNQGIILDEKNSRALPTLEGLELEDSIEEAGEEREGGDYVNLEDDDFDRIQRETISAVYTAVESASFFVSVSLMSLISHDEK